MAFEYIGLTSLRDPEIFLKILASAVSDTGLAYDFEARGRLKNVDAAFDMFQRNAFFLLTKDDIRPSQAFLGLIALAIHCISYFRVFSNDQVYFTDTNVVGLHAAAIRKNPNELVALTFGLAIAEIQAEWARSPTGLLHAPQRVDLRAVTRADIRHAVRIIAENRNRDLRADNGQYRQTFLRLAGLLRRLRSRQRQSR